MCFEEITDTVVTEIKKTGKSITLTRKGVNDPTAPRRSAFYPMARGGMYMSLV